MTDFNIGDIVQMIKNPSVHGTVAVANEKHLLVIVTDRNKQYGWHYVSLPLEQWELKT